MPRLLRGGDVGDQLVEFGDETLAGLSARSLEVLVDDEIERREMRSDDLHLAGVGAGLSSFAGPPAETWNVNQNGSGWESNGPAPIFQYRQRRFHLPEYHLLYHATSTAQEIAPNPPAVEFDGETMPGVTPPCFPRH